MLRLTTDIVSWIFWTLVLACVICAALACVPSVIVWCLLFDAD